MWGNFWAVFSLGASFALARLSMMWTTGHEEWAPRLEYAAVICFAISLLILAWPFVSRLWKRERPAVATDDAARGAGGDTYIASIGQQGGQTTQNITHNHAPPQRHVQGAGVRAFLEHSAALNGAKVPLRLNDPSGEARTLFAELHRLFTEAGCQVFGQDAAGTLPPFVGCVVEVDDLGNLPETARTIKAALDQAGVGCTFVKGPWKPGTGAFRITVGASG